jgi:heme-degrading monooxygenase HmoA
MVTFGLNYDVKSGAGDRFERAMAEVLRQLPSLPGHRQTRLYRDVHRPDSYLVYSEWDRREDFHAFTASDAFRAAVALGEDLLQGPPRHRVFLQEVAPPGTGARGLS